MGRTLNKKKSPRGNRTTGITAHQQAEKRRKRSKLTIKDASAEQPDALSEFMPTPMQCCRDISRLTIYRD